MTSCIISPACSKSPGENWNALSALRAEREGTRRGVSRKLAGLTRGDGEGEGALSALCAISTLPLRGREQHAIRPPLLAYAARAHHFGVIPPNRRRQRTR